MTRIAACAVALACALGATQAGAHAFLERATPAVGSQVASAPPRVTLRFTERLEPAFSRLEVDDATGKRIDRNDTRVSDDDASVLSVGVPKLPPGRYTVKWRVLSVDTHVTEGDFAFEVRAPGR